MPTTLDSIRSVHVVQCQGLQQHEGWLLNCRLEQRWQAVHAQSHPREFQQPEGTCLAHELYLDIVTTIACRSPAHLVLPADTAFCHQLNMTWNNVAALWTRAELCFSVQA